MIPVATRSREPPFVITAAGPEGIGKVCVSWEQMVMKRSMIAAAFVAGGVALVSFADLFWNVETKRGVGRLRAGHRDPGASPFSRGDLAGLPAPVQRYFDFALTPGQPLVRYARLRQSGDFAMRAGSCDAVTAT